MLYPKEYLTGRDIDLKKYNLGVIKQFTVDEFMYDYDLIDFIKPFYVGKSLAINEELQKEGKYFSCFMLLSVGEDGKMFNSLINSVMKLYNTDDVKFVKNQEELMLMIKKDNKAIAYIDDSNFDMLNEVMLEMCYFEKPKPEPEMKGDEELVKIMKEARKKYQKEHESKESLTFEGMVHDVIHYRMLRYDNVKSWSIWQLKDVFLMESFRENADKQFLLATNSRVEMDLKKIKRWQDEMKMTR